MPHTIQVSAIVFKAWAEDLKATQNMDTSSPTTSQTGAPSMKRNAFVMEEPSDSPPVSPSQKRARFIAAGESSGRPAPSILSSNLPSGDARLNVHAASPQTPTRSTATYSPSNLPSGDARLNAHASSPQTPTISTATYSPSNLPSGDPRLNAHDASPQTPTISTATYSPSASPDPFDLQLGSQQSTASTAQDHNMAGGMASSLSSGDLMLESIVEMVNNLGNVPDYIRKLDGKRVAAEKSRDVQAKKIQDLEDEVERLKDRQNELELIIAGYKAKGKDKELQMN